MKNYLDLSGSLQTITLKTNVSGSIQINSIIPDTSSGAWSGQYYSDCPLKLTVIPNSGYEFTGWEGDITGNETTVTLTLSEAMTVQASFAEKTVVKGDVNADGQFTVADVVAMQQYLINAGTPAAPQSGDLTGDGQLDVFDLCLMRSELVKNKET